MKQFWLQVVVLMLVAFTAMYLTFHPSFLDSTLSPNGNGGSTQNPQTLSNQTKTIMIVSSSNQAKATLKVEVADSVQKRGLGLGERNSLDANSGMLFLFDSPTVASFWMKGMRFPIDIIWISGDTVIGAQENAPPPLGTPGETLPIYSPTEKIDKVLEVNAGFVRSHNITKGDKLQQAL